MSKGKLVGIIVGCIITIIVAIVVTIHSPLAPPDEKPEYVAVSTYDFAEELFDPQLTSLQRENLWGTYEGKQVRWISELEAVATGEEGDVAYLRNPLDWKRTRVEAAFDEGQQADLAELKEGDLAIYMGILASFGEDVIRLRDCTIVSLALVPLWWNDDIDTSNKRILIGDEVLCLGPSAYDDAHEYRSPEITVLDKETGHLLGEIKITNKDVLVGMDSPHIYVWFPERIVRVRDVWSVYSRVMAVDEASGQIPWISSSPDEAASPPYVRTHDFSFSEYVNLVVLGEAKRETTNHGGPGLIFLEDKPFSKLTYEHEGVTYKSACAIYGGSGRECGALQAIDQETGGVLWMTAFQEKGMNDFSVVDGILYVSTDRGVGAFKL